MSHTYPAARLSAHIGHMFLEYPFEQRIGRAAAAGFGAVEHPDPFEIPARIMRRLVRDSGVTYTQLATGFGDMSRGEIGIACIPGRETEFRESLNRAVDYAAEVECRLVHILAGVTPPDVAPERLWQTYMGNLEHTAALCGAYDMTVLIEFTSELGDPGYFINDHHIARRAVAAAGRDNIRIMIDTFHVAAENCDAVEIVQDLGSLLGHVHIADFPGRAEPGTGKVDFIAFREALSAVGYAGAIGFEYDPAGRTEDGLAWLPGWLPAPSSV